MADPDLQIKGEPGQPDPEIRRSVLKNFFSALQASVWSKIKGGARASPLDPPLYHVISFARCICICDGKRQWSLFFLFFGSSSYIDGTYCLIHWIQKKALEFKWIKDVRKRHRLTIIPWARTGSESIARRPKGYWLRDHEGENRNNCFSKIQLVGQKYWDKTT